MKIYIIPAWYPQNDNDITAGFFREQAHALAARGHEITVIHIEPISFTYLCRKPWHYQRIWQDGSVRTVFHKVIVPIPAKMGMAQDDYISKLFCRIIKKQIESDIRVESGAPDLIHAHVSHSCAYYCLYAKEKLGIPLVVTEHYSGLLLGTASEREYERVRETIEKSDAFIFVGSNFQKTLCDRLHIKNSTYVIPNMVNVSEFEIKKKQNKNFTFLSAGNLKANKSFDLVIRAFHQAFDRSEPVKLVIAGDGDEKNNLERLISKLNEENRITMFGRYSGEQKSKLFTGADAFVLTSKVETFGIVYIEALASGLPCIGTSGQGADDIIDRSNGYLVEYGNADELARRMREIYFNYAVFDARKIRQSCVERFSNESVCQQIEKVYQELL